MVCSTLRAASPSLLVGLLQDADGNPFTPSHTVKHGRRYRYYVCKPTKNDPAKAGRPDRLPAHDIESLVSARLRAFFQSDRELVDQLALPTDPLQMTQQLVAGALDISTEWPSASPVKLRELTRKIIKRIVIHPEKVELYLNRSELRDLLVKDHSTGQVQTRGDDLFILETVAMLKRCGRQVRLVFLPNSSGETSARSSPSLLKAVARAHEWRERIVNGAAKDIRSLSQQTGLEVRYLRRVLECASLAPDIVEAILDGRQPQHLTAQKLQRNLSLDWTEQRKQLGFPAVRP